MHFWPRLCLVAKHIPTYLRKKSFKVVKIHTERPYFWEEPTRPLCVFGGHDSKYSPLDPPVNDMGIQELHRPPLDLV